MIPLSVQAGLWGLLAGGALLLGAGLAASFSLPQKVIAGIMAFGSGVLVSALAVDLMGGAVEIASLEFALLGFLGGAVIYSAADWLICQRGGHSRKRSGDQQASESDQEGSGLAIAVGALLDGIPESIAIGLTLATGGQVAMGVVVAVFISNVPEGLASSAGMRRAGRSSLFIYTLWGSIALISGLCALLGYTAFSGVSPQFQALITAGAAGAMLAMLVDTMIPEAAEQAHEHAGLLACLGFAIAYAVSFYSG